MISSFLIPVSKFERCKGRHLASLHHCGQEFFPWE